MKASRVIAGGPWRGLVRSRTATLRGVRSLLSQIFKAEPTVPPGVALDFADLTDEKLAWRRNILTETEFRNGLTDAPVRGGAGIAAATMAGFAGAIAFTKDANGSYAYKQATMQAGVPHTVSVLVLMDDGLAPTFANGDVAAATNDFVLVLKGDALSALAYTVQAHPGMANVYRVSCSYTPTVTALGNVGVVKYGGNSARNFKVTGYHLQRGAMGVYQPLTDVATEFLAAFPAHSLYQDHVANLPAWSPEQTVGLALDMRQAGARGVEVNPDVGMNNSGLWSYAGTAPLWSVANGVGQCTATSTGNRWITSGTTITSGKWYEIYADVTVVSGGCLPDISGNFAVFATKTGRWHWILQATTTSMQFLANGGFVGSIDNVSFREVPGNHAIQATAGDRPVVSARANWLIATEDFSNAAWSMTTAGTGSQAVKTPLYAAAPDGTLTACRVQLNRGTGTTSGDAAWINQSIATGTMNGMCAIWMKSNTGANQSVAFEATGAGTNVVTLTPTWQKFLTPFGAFSNLRIQTRGTYGGDLILDFLIWRGQAERTSIGVGPYQYVNTATDYDAIGFVKGVRFNGTGSWLSIGALDLSASNKLGAVVSLRKESDSGTTMVAELSGSTAVNDGTFGIRAPQGSGAANYGFALRGTGAASGNDAGRTTAAGSYSSPTPNVVSIVSDLSGADIAAQLTPRVNAVVPALTTAGLSAAGGGNFGNFPFYIGRRAGSSLPFNGLIHRLAVRGGAADNYVAQLERWANEPIKVLA